MTGAPPRVVLSADGRLLETSLDRQTLRDGLAGGSITELEIVFRPVLAALHTPDTLTGPGNDFLPASLEFDLVSFAVENGCGRALYRRTARNRTE